MNLLELARFLGMDQRQATKMAQRGQIPCQKVAGQYRFNRAEITEWMQQNLGPGKYNLVSMDESKASGGQVDQEEMLVSPLLCEEAISTQLAARTKSSLLRELVSLAQETQQLYDGSTLLEALNRREELCSTAMEGGIAIPHPRRPLPYAVAEPILVIAQTTQGIGFGAPDGRLTDLFFMTCSQNDQDHLHMLARLCRMLNDPNFPQQLRDAKTPEEITSLMRQREKTVIKDSI
jgi:PTS system nitrogen regulatory IIA component